MKKIAALLLLHICIVTLIACSQNKTITDIATFDSPDGNYHLVFQQVGEPVLFGGADVRLVLKDQNGTTLNSIDATVSNDGANAHEKNIKSVEWTSDSVIVILCAEEMPDKRVEIQYSK